MDEKPPTLDYPPDESLRTLRRGMRWMIGLTLLNTVLLGTSVFAPGITAFARAQWASYQAARAARAQAAQERAATVAMMTAQADAMRFALPPDTLVFAEDFAPNTLPLRGTTSATLPATRRSQVAGPVGVASMPTPAAVRALPKTIDGFGQIVQDSECYLFVHARRARPESAGRLVLCCVNTEFTSYRNARRLLTVVMEPATAGAPLRYSRYVSWEFAVPDAAKGEPPLRFYAGQADADDASRWRIAYEWGRARGTIAARLTTGDSIDLVVDGPLAPYVKCDSQ